MQETDKKLSGQPSTAFLIKKRCLNIPPLVEENKFVTNISSKASIFNTYFAEQCKPLLTDSVLPDIEYKTVNKLYNILGKYKL